MSKGPHLQRVAFFLVLILVPCAVAQQLSRQQLDAQYQAAVADFNAGRFEMAAGRLEKVLPYATHSYVVHELLGLVYASLAQNDKALDQLKLAVQIKPDAPDARTNLGAFLLRTGRHALAGEQFLKAQQLAPQDYEANHDLGEFYVQSGKIQEAQPLLENAWRIQPDAYDNSYDLAMADFQLGKLAEARVVAQQTLQKHNTGELHNLLAQIHEKDGKFVDAANEYEAAAHMDPSEDNLFDWGSEMLLHRTYEPAIAIFQQATLRYPHSPRLFIGLGLALYSRGKYDDAVKALLAAADLAPSDARCYYFLSKAYDSSPTQADEVIARFQRYASLQPGDAKAQYYYALSLWKGKRAQNSNVDSKTVESLLQKSITLDPSFPQAHVQLGDLYADQHEYEKSIPEYERALQLDPSISDAHYRLGTDYVHAGQRDKAQQEFAIYQKLRAAHLAEVEKERAEVQQFVYTARNAEAAKQ
ncbi:MAG: tetratricopeptide repeat protein [Terracidiphilus sp.]